MSVQSRESMHEVRRVGQPALAAVVLGLLAALGIAVLIAEPAVAQTPTLLTIVTEAPDDPSQPFSYNLINLNGVETPQFFAHSDGDQEVLVITPGRRYVIDQDAVAGWDKQVTCVDDNGGATVGGFGPGNDIDFTFLTPGTQAVCTFSNTRTGSAGVTFAFASDLPAAMIDLYDEQNGASITLTPGQTQRVPVTALVDLRYSSIETSPTGTLQGSCVGTTGLLTVELSSISARPLRVTGQVPAGAEATCTFQLLDSPTVPISLTIVGPQVAYNGSLRIGGDLASETVFSLSAGETWTGAAPLGPSVQLGVVGPGSLLPDSFTCEGDASALFFTRYFDAGVMEGFLNPNTGIESVQCTATFPGAVPAGIYPTVTCLAGNGRIDVNVVNSDSAAHTYRLEVGDLPARARSVAGNDWWRSPITGRPDGPISTRLLRDGVVILDTVLTVACDAQPAVSTPEVQVINVCRGGKGFVAWQFANPTDATRGYVIAFDGVPNRSTTAAAFGATVRGTSGRPNGVHGYSIRTNGVTTHSGSVTVACS